jgi:hypothetical protein
MSSSSSSDSGGGGNAREAAISGQYQDTKPSAPPGGGATSLGSGRDYSPISSPTRDARETYITESYGGVVEPAYEMAGGEKFAVGDPAIEEARDVVEKEQNLIEKAIDIYQKFSPLGIAINFLDGLLDTTPSTGNVGPAGIKTDGTYGTVQDAIRAGQRNEPLTQGQRDLINAITPYAVYSISGTTPPAQSMVQQYFNNLGMGGQSPLSSKLETDYNTAKQSVNSLLGIVPPNQQFGYSTQPYGLLSPTNLADNPFNIEYMRTRGLI